jgi:hypothetical protein
MQSYGREGAVFQPTQSRQDEKLCGLFTGGVGLEDYLHKQRITTVKHRHCRLRSLPSLA